MSSNLTLATNTIIIDEQQLIAELDNLIVLYELGMSKQQATQMYHNLYISINFNLVKFTTNHVQEKVKMLVSKIF